MPSRVKRAENKGKTGVFAGLRRRISAQRAQRSQSRRSYRKAFGWPDERAGGRGDTPTWPWKGHPPPSRGRCSIAPRCFLVCLGAAGGGAGACFGVIAACDWRGLEPFAARWGACGGRLARTRVGLGGMAGDRRGRGGGGSRACHLYRMVVLPAESMSTSLTMMAEASRSSA